MNALCVVFDIDDTLYPERQYVMSGFAAMGEWAARWLGVSDFADRCGRAHDEGLRGEIFNTVLSDCGIPADRELILALVSLYRTHAPSIALFEDAADALAAVSASHPVGVISDGPPVSQSRKAEALGLSQFASPILLTGIYGAHRSKPSPFAFEKIEGATPARGYMYIADNPLKDFTAPAARGWRTIRVRRAGGLHCHLENTVTQPDYELPDCKKIAKIVANL